MLRRQIKAKIAGGFVLLAALVLLGSEVAADSNALFRAVEDGDKETVRTLIDNGVDVNERNRFGSFALNSAAVKNNLELLRLLLDSGADVNLQSWSGDTALICATKYAGGEKETVALLLDSKSDTSLKDEEGKTALDYAKENNLADAVALLEKSS